uniref:Ryanodine receptor 3 n=1 Tax=Phallusia mammillata TaxID=59560 RepID=A0A6F9DS65_9ASCI|nr:ryanodine receptor 3 [Phallusia mammillata]
MAEGGEGEDEVHFLRTDDEIYLQCISPKEQNKLCLAAEGFGNRLCYVEHTSDDKDIPTDTPRCMFVLSQALSVRALHELLAHDECLDEFDDEGVVKPSLTGEEQAEGGSTHSRTLLYGNAIQLRHDLSGMFLTCMTTSSSASDKLAFDVGLSGDNSGESCWWTVHPTSKQRSEGEKVRVGDDVILISISSERYLHFSPSDKGSVQASFQQTMWNVGPVACGGAKAQGYLTGGDSLRMFHGHMDDCLAVPSSEDKMHLLRSVIYESGGAGSHAKSLWRLELVNIKWSGAHVGWGRPFRLRHITSGLYLCMMEDRSLSLMNGDSANYSMSTFCWQPSKDKLEPVSDQEIEGMGTAEIKYGDSVCFLQHNDTGMWITYQASESKPGRSGCKERKAIPHPEGHMDDGLTLSRSRAGESRTATVIRRTGHIFTSFVSALESHHTKKFTRPTQPNLDEVGQCVEDLIDYFQEIEQNVTGDDDTTDEHEDRQHRAQQLINRQDLFQEEGAIALTLQCIDKLGAYGDALSFASEFGNEAGSAYEEMLNSMYVLLAATVRGNRSNCAKFAKHLEWLVTQLDGQQATTGILEVLNAVLTNCQEALNLMKPEHIRSIVSLLEKQGRNSTVLEVLCSLCVCNGVAVRPNQNLICETLLPSRDILLQTALVDYITNVQPNIYIGVSESCAQYKKWYYELLVERVDSDNFSRPPHLRVGWANSTGYSPYPVGGDYFGESGVGDDTYSFGYDGLSLWTSHRRCPVGSNSRHILSPNDIVSCCMDLSGPSISFRINGQPVQGMFENFNLTGLFFPVVSFSAGVRVRFLFGGPHGEFRFLPPVGYAPAYEALLPSRRLTLSPCKSYGQLARGHLLGPGASWEHTVFVPDAVNTQNVILSHNLQAVVPKLAEGIHELWAMTRIQGGWAYGTVRDEVKKQNPCLVEFARLPEQERNFNLTMSFETLRTIIALGYHVGIADEDAEYKLKRLKLPRNYMMASGYKPAPIDLSHVRLTHQMEELVEKLANNAHNVWARERVKQGWTYGVHLDVGKKRNPRLVPFSLLDDLAKQSNRNSIRELVRTLIGHGYMIEPPDDRLKKLDRGAKNQVQYNRMRIYRAERTHAVSTNKWYFEFTVESQGDVRVGWARPDCSAWVDLGTDQRAYVFDGVNALKWHNGSENFGQRWNIGDVIGCLLDLNERTISFTLNGEILIDRSGQEFAFSNLPPGIFLVPAASLNTGQSALVNLGQDVTTLKYFTTMGLQEGYKPFAEGMKSQVAIWFTKNLPCFVTVDETNRDMEVIRIPASNHKPPRLKVLNRRAGNSSNLAQPAEWIYTRLNMPVKMDEAFTKNSGRLINMFTENESMMDDDIDGDFEVLRKTARGGLTPSHETKQERPHQHHHHHLGASTLPIPGLKAPKFHFRSKSSASAAQTANNTPAKSRLTEEVLPDQYTDVLYKNDIDQLLHSTQYSFTVRVFPDQEPGSVYVGWVTSDFHWNMDKFRHENIPSVTLTLGDEKGKVSESIKRSNCYVIWCGDLHQHVANGQSNNGLLVTCMVDIATGLLTFSVNGKDLRVFYQVEPGVMLYPAVFALPSAQSVFQYELGRSKNCMPLSAAVFECERKNVIPQCPPRLVVQSLARVTWTRMPTRLINAECRRELERSKGWTAELRTTDANYDAYNMAVLHIPEENRCVDLLELSENNALLDFHEHTLKLYCALCALGNSRVAHVLSSYVDQRQMMYIVKNSTLVGSMRAAFHDLLIEMHLAPHANARRNTQNEYIFPLNDSTRSVGLFEGPDKYTPGLPGVGIGSSLRPRMHWSTTDFVTSLEEAYSRPVDVPEFPLDALRHHVINQLEDAVTSLHLNYKEVTGLAQQHLFVPLLRLTVTLLTMGVLEDNDIKRMLVMLDPECFGNLVTGIHDIEDLKASVGCGLLRMSLVEPVKLEACRLLHYLNDLQLRHRVEALVSFSTLIVSKLQQDQRSRYQSVMEALNMSAAMTAKMTKEFRSPPNDQMALLLSFKSEDSEGECPLPDEIRDIVWNFHMDMLCHCGEYANGETEEVKEESYGNRLKSLLSRVLRRKTSASAGENGLYKENTVITTSPSFFRDLTTQTMVTWAQEKTINDPKLVREIFSLLYRQFDGIGELNRALKKAYCISAISEQDTMGLLDALSRLRSLLSVKLGREEEALIIKELNKIMNNKVFYQHPNLMRVLCMHETVMEVMVSVLGEGDDDDNGQEVRFPRMVAACCRFLCYFCRISRMNQGAMFDKIDFLLEHGSVGLASPSMRGSTPLDVAAASVMDNNELALALRESDLETLVENLANCGLQSSNILLRKGYPDLGWNPVEGERYLDFLKHAVFVNGESVEENANLVVRQLIRRPECFSPSLRGEGGQGLLSAVSEALQICRDPLRDCPDPAFMHHQYMVDDDEEEEEIHMGFSILAFYSALIDLLGRCAPEQNLIEQGKSEAIRIRGILRSLVSLEDLIGVISLPFDLPRLERDGSSHIRQPDLSACFVPDHKSAMILFLQRVYGIDNPQLLIRILEVGLLPDMKAAAQLDTPALHSSDMALALNRYMCHSVLPLIIRHVELLGQSQHRVVLLDQVLHTVYRMSRARALTKAQKEMISDCLVAVAGVLRPSLLQGLLRKLTFDVPTLTEETYIPIRLLAQHYTRCWKYYYLQDGCVEFGFATDEEKHLTMVLFWGLFDSLSKREYEHELFSKVLPCLCSIGNALPPDYALSPAMEKLRQQPSLDADGKFNPKPVDTKGIIVPERLESFVNKYSEQWHDTWALDRFSAGWSYGPQYSDHLKQHPLLKPYRLLSDREKDVYRPTVREGLKTLDAWGWSISKVKETAESFNQTATKIRCSSQSTMNLSDSPHGYSPRPYDLSGVSLSREMATTAEMLAENFHLAWAKKKISEMEAKAAAAQASGQPVPAAALTPNPMLVPYDRLTAKEKEKDRNKAYDMLKFLQFQNYMLNKEEKDEVELKSSVEKRFSSMLLSRLLGYVDEASKYITSMIQAIEATKQRQQESIMIGSMALPVGLHDVTASDDIKFFAKVALPFIDSYFKTQQIYYVTVAGRANEGMSFASNKEKESVTMLFCKMALLIRQRTSFFGVDAQVAISCIKVLAECIDASTVSKSCPEQVKQSLTTFFNNAAEDLKKMLNYIRSGRVDRLQKMMTGAQNTSYVTHCLLPVLTTLFSHLGKYKFGKDLLLDEIQVACYRILNGLYSLGTGKADYVDRLHEKGSRRFSLKRVEAIFENHRSQVGECLAAFASAFPVSFLEPRLNKFNAYSIYNILSIKDRKMLGLPSKLEHLTPRLPNLNSLLADIGRLAESGAKYDEAPEMIDIILPMICSYLTQWLDQGPDFVHLNAKNSEVENPIETDSAAPGGCSTIVANETMTNLLKDVLRLIHNNLGIDEADWMRRIAVYTLPIMVRNERGLLESHFLPILNKTLKKLRQTRDLEEQLASHHGNPSSELLNIVKYEQRVSDVSDLELIMLEDYGILVRDLYAYYPLLARFIDICKSNWIAEKNQAAVELFQLVSEIFVIWSKSLNLRREEQNFVIQNQIDNMSVLTADKSAAPNAAGLLASRRTVKRRGDRYSVSTSLIVACVKRLLSVGLNVGMAGDYTLVQEAKSKFHKRESDEDIREFLLSNLTTEPVLQESAKQAESDELQALTRKRVDWLLEISRVQYHLYMVEHPSKSRRAVWRKLMSKQRKRAVVSCFRMVPLYNLPTHRVSNCFLSIYMENWLTNDEQEKCALIDMISPGQDDGTEGSTPPSSDPLRQLIQVFSMAAVTSQGTLEDDELYLNYSELMSQSCHTGDDDEEGGEDDDETGKSFEEKEREKQRLIYEQKRLATRGAAQMVLYTLSASGGELSDTVTATLELGIALLTGGNQLIQKIMLEHLQAKKDVKFFTSVAGLMDQCSVLDLDAYERCIKAETLGHVNDGSSAGEKTMHDADFTCALFRFLQLLCEGHNADFQNYLRTQVGNNTTVNIIISTVDYLLRLQESISDFYWYYSAKETIDANGQENFSKAIRVAKQVFNSLTEYIQGPCEGNQQALAHSRLWDAVVGFLHVFANMQMKLSQDSGRQLSLLNELLDLQQDMVVMLLSMLEGNVVDGTIGRQLVDTLIESSHNVGLIIRFFNMFLRLKDITESDKFKVYDPDNKGLVTRRDFHRAMEASKVYSIDEIEFLLSCALSPDEESLNYQEFTEQFHGPAADIGFNVAVLLTNLSEHMPKDTRLKKFLEMAEAMLEYFRPNLGRIEIVGGAKRIERVYFNIRSSSLDQWHKPQVQESKRQFFFDVINTEGDKGRMDEFVNFCEDTIFEMQLAADISEAGFGDGSGDAECDEEEAELEQSTPGTAASVLPSVSLKSVKKQVGKLRAMTWIELFIALFWTVFAVNKSILRMGIASTRFIYNFLTILLFSNSIILAAKSTTMTQILSDMPNPTREGVEEHTSASESTDDGIGRRRSTMRDEKDELLSNVFGLDMSHGHELIKAVVNPKRDAGFGDFSVEETADTLSMIASDYDSGISTPVTPAGVVRKRRLRRGRGLEKSQISKSGSDHSSTGSPDRDSRRNANLSDIRGMTFDFDHVNLSDPVQSSPWGHCMHECGRPKRYTTEEKVEDKNAAFWDRVNGINNGIMGIFARNFYNFKILALAVTFAINVSLLFYKWQTISDDLEGAEGSDDMAQISMDDKMEDDTISLPEELQYLEAGLRFFTTIHLFLSLSMLVSYYRLKVPLVIFKREKEVARKLEFDGLYVNEDPADDDLPGQWDRLVISCPSFPSNYWDKFVKKKVMDKFASQCGQEKVRELLGMDQSTTSFLFEEEKTDESLITQMFNNFDLKYTVWKVGVIFCDQSFLYLLWYLVMSVFGQYNRFFFSLHLLDIAVCSKGLRTILTSVTHNGKQLILTIGLLTVVAYLYTVIAFNFFKKFYNKGEGDEPDYKCHSMFTCFQFHIYAGVRAGGGIGDELEDPSGDDYEFYRIFFDISFFFFVVVILLAIIQGLIIDAFGELRDQQEQVKEDMETKCFICTIGNDYFDQVPHGFDTHTMQEHNLANYMFFLMHLINKDETEYTGQETYVWQQYQERCWEFFPAGDCFRKQYEAELAG